MKKNLFLITFLALNIVSIFATTYTVGHTGCDYDNIQAAVNAASDGDDIHVYYYYAGYEGFSYNGKNLDIYSQGYPKPIINGDLSNPALSVVVDMSDIDNSSYQPSLDSFEIIGANTATGVLCTNYDGSSAGVLIENNLIHSLNIGISLSNNDEKIRMESNVLYDNTTGLYDLDTSSNVGSHDELLYCELYNNTTGIYLGYESEVEAVYCLLYDNDTSIDLVSTGYIDMAESTISNSSLSNTDTGICISSFSVLVVENCILYGNETQIDDSGGTISITYSDVEGGYTGTGNIDSDPYFCKETDYEYYLLEGSPCIDTGDPTDTDSDGTRLDMGCYPSIIDIKYCEGDHYNWVSFPKLDRDDDEPDEATDFLELFTDWDFDLELRHTSDVVVLEYSSLSHVWNPTSYDAYSSKGYKLNPEDSGEYYLLSQSAATRLDPTWELDYTVYAETRTWIGYWLPYTQNIEDAFGEFWENVFSVDAEDWYYEYDEEETPTSSTTNKDLVYGKGYIVTFYEDVEDFYWTDATSRGLLPGGIRPDPIYFTYSDLPSYEAIDIMEIPENVIEIGVFEGDTCIGAVVVQNEDEQMLAYSTNANRENIPLSFEVVTNNRSGNLIVSDYLVRNDRTGVYENRSLISGQQKHSVIMFGNLEDPQNNTPVIDSVVLHNNYPNPFNPETNISFSLPSDQEVELCVYNMKGQLVRQLISGQFTSGDHSVTWDGTDHEGKNVSTGLYLYKLKTCDHEYSKKMLLLK